MIGRITWLALCVFLAAMVMPDLARGQVELSAAQVFDLAQQLAEHGEVDRAINLLKVVIQDKDMDVRAEARVRIARYLNAQGDKSGALHWYRELLAEKPDTAAVRLEVALLLASMGEEGAAANELRRAEAVGLPPEVSRTIHDTADLFWNRRPFGGDLSIGIAPDTNINSATSSDKVTIFGLPFQLSDDAQAQSGVGLTFDTSATVRWPISGMGRFIAQAGVAGRVYRNSRFNDATFSASAGPELILSPTARIRPALLVGRRFYGVDRLYDFYGVTAAGQLSLTPKAQLTVSGTLTDFNYTSVRKSQSGPAYSSTIAYDRALSGRLSARAGITLAKATAFDKQFATNSISGDITLSRDMGRWTLWTRESFTWLRGEADYAFFDVPRRDKIAQLDAGLIFRRLSIFGLSPQIRVTYLNSASSIPLFRYRRTRSEFSLAKSF